MTEIAPHTATTPSTRAGVLDWATQFRFFVRNTPRRLLLMIGIAIVLIVQFFPLIWMLLTSLMTANEVNAIPATLWPGHPSLSNYLRALQSSIGHYYLNSVIVSVVSTALTMSLALLAGYAFARLRFRFKAPLLVVVLGMSLFPHLAQVIPLYLVFYKTHLLNTLFALIIPYTIQGMPIAVLTLIAFFQDIPQDLEEAAQIDGTTQLGAFLRVIVPLALPGFFTTAIIVFVENWNEYLFALNFTTPNTYTLPVGIVNIYQTNADVLDFGLLAAATVMSVVPLVVLIIWLEKRIVSGLTAGAVKG